MDVNNRNRSRRPIPEVAQHMKRMLEEHQASIRRQEQIKAEEQAPPESEEEVEQ